MFQFARQSAKAVLVAASAAGVAALGAGSAGADDLGALSATDSLPQTTPATAGLPAGLGGGTESLVSKVQQADQRTVQPVPSTPNLGTPAGDVSHVAPQEQDQLNSVHDTVNEVQHQAGAVDGTATTLPAYDAVPQQGDPLGMLPTGDLTGLLGEDAFSVVPGGAPETLPLSNELPAPTSVQGQPAEIAGEAVGSAGEQTAGTVLPNTTDEVDNLAAELPEPSTGSVEDRLSETPDSVEGADTEAVESTVPATEQVQDAADTVTEEAPSVGEATEQVDTSEAAGDVVEGVGTPAL
ncbi:hypothetical protein [Streptomonospora wellingtoniae]|uniref:Secreted protein n=1 Tax=Streptomonospora wellingtoniae TaxID=3075544 RepID=A0ABU2KRE8_9ACTN|nr:hypothetical protein [Streptomonospora sp. DSM 45055]MDT0301855.1 hypothetical protein [Streptomonospora sp. DSM 45055]